MLWLRSRKIVLLANVFFLFWGLAEKIDAEIISALKVVNERMPDHWLSSQLFCGTDILVKNSNQKVKIKFKEKTTAAPYIKLSLVDPETDSMLLLFESPSASPKNDTIYIIDAEGNKHYQYETELKQYNSGTTLTFVIQDADTQQYNAYKNIGIEYTDFQKKIYTGQNRSGIDPFISEVKYDGSGLYYKRTNIGRVDENVVEVGLMAKEGGTFHDLMLFIENAWLEGAEKHKLPRPTGTIVDSGTQNYSIELFCPAVPDTLRTRKNDSTPAFDTTVYSLSLEEITIFYTLDGTNPYESVSKKEYTDAIAIDGPVTIKAYAQYSDDSLWLPSRLFTGKYGNFTNVKRKRIVSSKKVFIHDVSSVQSFRIDGKSLGQLALNNGGKRFPPGIVICREKGKKSCYPVLMTQ